MSPREDELLRSVALQNADSILRARRRAEEELLTAREELSDSNRRLQASEERLRVAFEQVAVGIAAADLDGHFIEMNRKFCELLGYSAEELKCRTFLDLTYPEDLDATRENMNRLVRGESRDFTLEKRYVRKDGSHFWSRTTVTLTTESGAAPSRYIGVIQDVSKARADQEEVARVNRALEEERASLELLNRSCAKLAASLDLRTILQTVTDSATELTGARFGAFFHNTVDENQKAYQLYVLSGAQYSDFERFGHPRATPVFGPTFRGDGVVRSPDITADPRYGHMGPHHGQPKGHLPVRSYLAVPVRSRSGEVIGGLFFGHPDVDVFSKRAERLAVGIAAQASISLDNSRLFEAAQRAAVEREKLLESERHARSQAERAGRMKDEFLATLSHELRTPLSAILGWAHLMRARPLGPEEFAKGLETIERNARLQTQLIEDLLDMSRIISGKLRLDVQSVFPVSAIEAAIETVRPAAEARGIRLTSTLDPGAGPVSGDPARLQQVVWNLLNNAIKFTERDGRVRVLLERVDSQVEISVTDNGTGIPPEFLTHVFERFRQADSSTTRTFGGLGLGLAIVKQLVELHGGTVRADSEGAGRGATFTVSLPVSSVRSGPREERAHPRAPANIEAAAFVPTDLGGLRILVVDDQPDACELVARMLGECGAHVRTASSGELALRLHGDDPADLIVSDIGMPGMDGYELIREVRRVDAARGRTTPAIAMTAFARSQDRTRALQAGFQFHLAKPVEPAELMATVASVAGRTGPAT